VREVEKQGTCMHFFRSPIWQRAGRLAAHASPRLCGELAELARRQHAGPPPPPLAAGRPANNCSS
jgi:hypothetical protein